MKLICGIDEVGRGPLAGPVTAAAVILPEDFDTTGLADSKKLTEKQRERQTARILDECRYRAIGWVSSVEIDALNIHNATLLAMERAYAGLHVRADEILIDGKYVPEALREQGRAVIRGDTLIPAIQAASILAKTARDRWMVRYSWIEANYGFEQHKGYPTKEHRKRWFTFGPSPIHRRSFRVSPVA